MARTKATFSSVDLARAMKAAKAAGLTITYRQIDPDGKIALGRLCCTNLTGFPLRIQSVGLGAGAHRRLRPVAGRNGALATPPSGSGVRCRSGLKLRRSGWPRRPASAGYGPCFAIRGSRLV